MHRGRIWFLVLLLCGGCAPGNGATSSTLQAAAEAAQTPSTPAASAAAPAEGPGRARSAPAVASPAAADPALPADDPPPSLWTRRRGVDWPVFLGPTRDSKSSETGILTRWSAARPRVVWHCELGTSYGAPAVSGGRLFQFDRFGDHARLYCLNAETGQELWRTEVPTAYDDLYGYNNGPRCSPLVDGGRVYAYGVDGVLFCCRAADGRLLWKRDLNQEFGVVLNFFGVGSNPVIEGDLVLCMVGGSPPESQRVAPGQLDRVEPNGTAIVAFDKRTGEVRYKLGNDLASYASLQLATINGRRWGFAFCREGLLAFEPTRGVIDFHYPWRAPILESVNASVPVVAGDEVFISETYGPGSSLLRVSPGQYDVLWKDDRRRDKAMQTHWMTPVFLDGYLYGSSGRHPYNAELRCIEWKTGKVRWSIPELTRTSLLYVDGHFVCLGEYGQLSLFKANPEKYEPVARLDVVTDGAAASAPADPRSHNLLKYPCWAAPILSHGLLYVRGEHRLVCLELIPET